MTQYAPPLDRLLTYGEPEFAPPERWRPYVSELGLTLDDVPELVRMTNDQDLNSAKSDDPRVWAPIHAIRALGELRAEAAIGSLISLADAEDDDWITNEVPKALGLIGPKAIPPLESYLGDQSRDGLQRATAVGALEKISEMHPAARGECVSALARQLESFEDNPEELNGFLIGALVDLGAEDFLPLMRRAFEGDRVDEDVIDWREIRREFGLTGFDPLEREDKSRPKAFLPPLPSEANPAATNKAKDAKKSKKKAAEKSRRKNRK
ncbi:MAG TPA: hypothetical protein DD435_03830 [Cyanobacteria bacterium UBA8530]|nr:hypothetical protein [Cyanobacteria bacterium UBA8530]